MDIDYVVETKIQLEKRLREFIDEKLISFRGLTGVSIKNISVHLSEELVIGEKTALYIVNSVTCDIAL